MKHSELTKEQRTIKKEVKLKISFRNAVARAIEEATMRDVQNIDKAAMGRSPVYDRYPEGSMIPARDDKGKVYENKFNGEPMMIDVSGQIICDYKGKPIIAVEGLSPDWKASAWRLERRMPRDWGSTQVLKVEKPDPLQNLEEDDPSKIEFIWVDPDGEKDE